LDRFVFSIIALPNRLVPVGQTLQCFQCDLGLWNSCSNNKTNCSQGEQCFVGIGKAVYFADIREKGCTPKEQCDKNTTVEFSTNKTLYLMKKSCCGNPLCNAAPEPCVALVPQILMFAVLALFRAKVLKLSWVEY
uniref:UPAR/Ly6 domain-containing protein n=1 Tax=Denticeps clupeoides TaxID=299321 RepID=A0AAY4EFU2_9TELE